MAEEYAEECSRLACLQLAAMTGFETVGNSSLTVLSDMLQTHIKDLCTLARSYSEGAGRTKVNAEDLVLGLGDMGIPFNQVREFRHRLDEDVPFPADISKFPVAPGTSKKPSFEETGEDPPCHVPGYLPIFPPKHTYIHTPVYPKHTEDSREKALKAHEAKKAAEDVLIRLGTGAAASSNPFVVSILDAGRTETACIDKEDSDVKTIGLDGANVLSKADEWTSLLIDRGDKKTRGSILPLPFGINPLGKVGTVSLEKKKRPRDAFEDKEKGKKESKVSTIDVSQFKFKIRESGLDGEVSEVTAVDGNDVKDLVKEATSVDTPRSHDHHRHATGTQDTPGLAHGKHLKNIGNTSQEEAKELYAASSASQVKQIDPLPYTVPGPSTSLNDNVKADTMKPQEEGISSLAGLDEDSFQSDPGADDGVVEEVVGGYTAQNDSQEYHYGLEIYEDAIAEGPAIDDDDEDKEPLVSGLFMDLDEGDKDDGKD